MCHYSSLQDTMFIITFPLRENTETTHAENFNFTDLFLFLSLITCYLSGIVGVCVWQQPCFPCKCIQFLCQIIHGDAKSNEQGEPMLECKWFLLQMATEY